MKQHPPSAGQDADAILEMMTPRLAAMEASAQPPESANPAFAYRPLSCDEMCNLPRLSWKVKNIFSEAGTVAVYGVSGSGKTFILLDMALAIAGGFMWFGRETIQAPVTYVCLESARGVEKRIKAWRKAYNRPFPAALSFIIEPFDLTNEKHVLAIIAAAPKNGVVVIDTLNRASLGTDENSSRDRGIVIKAASDIQAATDGLVVLVSHAGKNKDQGLRGHSSLFAALDAVIQIDRRSDGSRFMKLEKQKEGVDGEVFNFQLKTVVIGTDYDGNEITSCVVEPLDGGTKEDKPLTPAMRYALESLEKACEAEGNTGVHLDVWRQEFYAGHTGENPDAKKKAFQRAREGLVKLGIVSVNNDTYTGTERDKTGQVPPVPVGH